MSSLRAAISKLFRPKSNDATTRPPTVSWILEHRSECANRPALTNGITPLASLYRMYEYLVAGYTVGLRTEIELFFNQPSWAVAHIPDPQDPDPERYAILAVIPSYLVTAFNRLIKRGLPRDSPAIIVSREVEDELMSRPIVLEQEPGWTTKVPTLEKTLVIPDKEGNEPEEQYQSDRFMAMNIIMEEPHVLFV